MGASQSLNVTRLEEQHAAAAAASSSDGPPQIRKVETFEEKLYRKFSQEPLVPIGCLTTAYFLGSGIKSFYNHNAARSQRMMRARVGAQFLTILIFMGYAGKNAVDFTLAPMFQKAKQQQQKEVPALASLEGASEKKETEKKNS